MRVYKLDGKFHAKIGDKFIFVNKPIEYVFEYFNFENEFAGDKKIFKSFVDQWDTCTSHFGVINNSYIFTEEGLTGV